MTKALNVKAVEAAPKPAAEHVAAGHTLTDVDLRGDYQAAQSDRDTILIRVAVTTFLTALVLVVFIAGYLVGQS